eukprot:1158812-Pelagomonas_calceolata.AAC.9
MAVLFAGDARRVLAPTTGSCWCSFSGTTLLSCRDMEASTGCLHSEQELKVPAVAALRAEQHCQVFGTWRRPQGACTQSRN